MGHGTDGFGDQQAVLGHGEVDAAAAQFTGDAEVIVSRIIPEERKPEPVLAARRTVARPGIATAAFEDRHHIKAETDRARGGGRGHGERHLGSLTEKGDADDRFPVGHRCEMVAVLSDQ